MAFEKFYGKNYKNYMYIPLAVFILCVIASFFVPYSIDLVGGTSIRVSVSEINNSDDIARAITQLGYSDVSASYSSGVAGKMLDLQYKTPQNQIDLRSEIDSVKSSKSASDAKLLLSKMGSELDTDSLSFSELSLELDRLYNVQKNSDLNSVLSLLSTKYAADLSTVNVREVSPSLGEAFYSSAVKVVLLAILLIIVVIFIFFREVIPALAVILAGIMDVFGGLAGMALFDIPLSLITIPTLLMLLGYSIDTDVLLTMRVLRGTEGTPKERAGNAIATGLTMTLTTLAALLCMLIISIFYNITVIYYMSVILISGLLADIISTWLMNAPLLLWYVESKSKSK